MTPFELQKLLFLKGRYPHILSAEHARKEACWSEDVKQVCAPCDYESFDQDQTNLEKLALLLEKEEKEKRREVLGEHTLSNGRIYKITDTGQPYIPGEYPSGGLIIAAKIRGDFWSYIDNSPDEECVRLFLDLAESLSPVWF